jgi:hypothetical protein
VLLIHTQLKHFSSVVDFISYPHASLNLLLIASIINALLDDPLQDSKQKKLETLLNFGTPRKKN